MCECSLRKKLLGFVKLSKIKKLLGSEKFHCNTVYTAERFVLQEKNSEPQNPRFIIESGFKSRAVYNGARLVHIIIIIIYLFSFLFIPDCMVFNDLFGLWSWQCPPPSL